MTGDRTDAARGVAMALGIDEWYAELSPSEKAAGIRRLKEQKKSIAMVNISILLRNISVAKQRNSAGRRRHQ